MTTGEMMIEAIKRNFFMHHEIKVSAIKSINNIIFVVSTGTLVLSMTFIGYIKTMIVLPHLLIFSWTLFIISVVLNGYVHWCTMKVSVRNQYLLNQMLEGSAFLINMDTSNDPEVKKYTKYGSQATIATISVLSAGLVSLLVFVGINFIAQNQARKLEQANPTVPATVINNYYNQPPIVESYTFIPSKNH